MILVKIIKKNQYFNLSKDKEKLISFDVLIF